MYKHKTALLAAVVAGCTALPCFAGDTGTWYLGLGAGQAVADYSASQCTNDAASALGYVPSDVSIGCNVSNTDGSYQLLAGYNIDPNLAVEGAYIDLGSMKGTVGISGPTATAVLNVEQKTTAVSVEFVGKLPLSSTVALNAKIGLYNATVKYSDDAGDSTNSTNTGLAFGAGGSVKLNPNLSARLEYDHYNKVGSDSTNCDNCSGISQYNIDAFTAALIYNW